MKKLIFVFFSMIAVLIASRGYCDQAPNLKETLAGSSSEIVKCCGQSTPCCEPCPPPCPPCKECEICPPCEPCGCCTELPSTGEPRNCAYNAPARIDPACGWKTWIEASFIYWQAKEDSLFLAQYSNIVSLSPPPRQIHQKNIDEDFDFHPGFKIEGGVSIRRDDWTLYLEYTRLKSTNKAGRDLGDNFSFTTNYLQNFFLQQLSNNSSNSIFQSINSKWVLNFNLLDLELSRPYYVGQKVIFKPHFGLRSGWIDQRYDLIGFAPFVSSQNIQKAEINAKQDTWLMGAKAGLGSEWIFGCNYKILANISASLFYQKFSMNVNNYVSSNSVNDQIKLNTEFSKIIPNLECYLGIGYGKYFCNNQWHFDLCAGYDFQYFLHQNQFIFVTSIPFLSTDLMLQGLTIAARLDF